MTLLALSQPLMNENVLFSSHPPPTRKIAKIVWKSSVFINFVHCIPIHWCMAIVWPWSLTKTETAFKNCSKQSKSIKMELLKRDKVHQKYLLPPQNPFFTLVYNHLASHLPIALGEFKMNVLLFSQKIHRLNSFWCRFCHKTFPFPVINTRSSFPIWCPWMSFV